MKIYAHCLVKNEENFIWYSVASIVEHVDKVLVWDNGSTDATVQIIELLKKRWPSKISFKKFSGEVSLARQKMLDETDADWIIILDGDEVWWEGSIRTLISEIYKNDKNLDSVVVPFKNLTHDMFHFQAESKGGYTIDNRTGFITLKAINRKIKGLRIEGEYPSEGYCDFAKTLIQNLAPERRKFLDSPYMHLTHLRRSHKKSDKIKNGSGLAFPLDFYYPEVFFRSKPDIIPSPWI